MKKRAYASGCLLLCLGLTGCGAIAGQQDAPIVLEVKPGPNDTFGWHTTLTVDLGPTSVSDARLTGVSLTTIDPAGTPDLTYLSTLLGMAVGPNGEMQPFCTAAGFPAGQATADATVVFTGNILPFFDSQSSFHMDWSGTVNPAWGTFPPDGFSISAVLQVDPQ
jgi:hypothetical protein